MEIINGKKIREEILSGVKAEVATLPFQPIFCDVLVGSDPASVQYVQMKAKTAESVGMLFHAANFPASITTEQLIAEIKILNTLRNICGIIVQLPLPEHIDRQRILDSIDPCLDVDCLGTVASEKFYTGQNPVGFPAALACMVVVESLHLNLPGKKIVVLGQGMLVGKPVTALLRAKGLSPVAISNETPARNAYGIAVAGGGNKAALLKEADIIITGIGKGKYITGDMIQEGAVIIDAGTSEENGAIVGDVNAESVKGVAGFLSPVPGGVGPVTVAMLLRNVLTVAKKLK